ncbi:MAG: hypothetical protein JNG83_13530 [Opitutaceae bacterium]|nr:hypothetical protein [Opitutaceae bacterium]
MSHRLTTIVRYAFLVSAGLVAGSVLAQSESVSLPARRLEAIEQAKKLVAIREVVPLTANPFDAQDAQAAVAPTPNAGSTYTPPANLIQAIATSLKPSGYFVLGGEPTLVFGQKRVKAGGTLTITFEGNEYVLEITKIDRTNFTLRLNREEFTRPIK